MAGQGTIYPDVVESGGAKTKKAKTIKSHHNVGGLPETLGLSLLEPLRELFKDEVRELGLVLGLPPEMVYRHPFPGPGLGVRILGEVKEEYAELLRRADDIFYYAVQFHPEVTHTLQGQAILTRFVRDICGGRGDWRMGDYVTEAVARIREQVGQDHVILGLSGGVDSSVAAALIHKAIGDQLTCVFVDHGLLRLNEAALVMDMFAGRLHAKVRHVDAGAQFLGHLAGVTDPEAKRKIIGREFVEVFQAEAVVADRCEVAGAGHHLSRRRRVGRRQDEEVQDDQEPPQRRRPAGDARPVAARAAARAVQGRSARARARARPAARDGLSPPVPGPGLGVRILGEVKAEYADLLRRADDIFIQELRTTRDEATGKTWYDLTSQAFAVFLPVRSVGVMGDYRTYEHVVALRAVQTTDFMTADWAPLPMALLKKASSRIINEVRGINRVVYDISSKPPSTIEWE